MHNACFGKGHNPFTKLIPILSNPTKKLNKENSYDMITISDTNNSKIRYLK
jgi:hypothetical protein